MRRKAPPYAAQHIKAARAGLAPASGTVFVFDGWPKPAWLEDALSHGAWVAALPNDAEADADAYDWRWCEPFDVAIITAGRRTAALANALSRVRSLELLFVARDGFERLKVRAA